MRRRILAAAALAASLSGCLGYRSYFGKFPPELRSLAIPVFANDTFYTGLEMDLTRAVQEEMTRRQGRRLAEASEAVATLTGRLVQFSPREALTVGRGDDVVDRQAVASAEITVRTADGRALLENLRVTAAVTYRPALGQSEEQARRDVLGELARRIAISLLDRW